MTALGHSQPRWHSVRKQLLPPLIELSSAHSASVSARSTAHGPSDRFDPSGSFDVTSRSVVQLTLKVLSQKQQTLPRGPKDLSSFQTRSSFVHSLVFFCMSITLSYVLFQTERHRALLSATTENITGRVDFVVVRG